MELHPVDVVGVRVEMPSNQPIVLLKEITGERYLPIGVGAVEATAIAFAQQAMKPPRPLTHDLFVQAFDRMGVSIVRVTLTHVDDGVYFAEMVLRPEKGDETLVSCRPSDGLAIALRASCPVFASEALLDQVGELPDEGKGPEETEIIDEFREFIENISPEDFGD